MKSSPTFTCVWLLAVALSQVAAIGTCNNTLITELMAQNAGNCPTNLLEQMYEAGPMITFRVMSTFYAELFSCASGVLSKPVKNVAQLYNKYSFANESLGYSSFNYTMVEATCGFLYKYMVAEGYIGFKITYAYADGISFGYYGCTDEENPFGDVDKMYAMCYAPAIDTPEIEASLVKCKAHMELVTGDTDLVMTPACDNDNQYLEYVLAQEAATYEHSV